MDMQKWMALGKRIASATPVIDESQTGMEELTVHKRIDDDQVIPVNKQPISILKNADRLDKLERKAEKRRQKEKRLLLAEEAQRYSLKKIKEDQNTEFVYGKELGINLLKV